MPPSLDIEPPKEVWTVMSSGVLSRGLQLAWPDFQKVYGVRIGHNTTERERGRAETFLSKYKFNQECKVNEREPRFQVHLLTIVKLGNL